MDQTHDIGLLNPQWDPFAVLLFVVMYDLDNTKATGGKSAEERKEEELHKYLKSHDALMIELSCYVIKKPFSPLTITTDVIYEEVKDFFAAKDRFVVFRLYAPLVGHQDKNARDWFHRLPRSRRL